MNDPSQYHVLAGRSVYARCQQLGSGQDRGRERLDILKAREVSKSNFALICRHLAHPVGILLHEVGIVPVKRRQHLRRMFLIDTEHNRLGEAVFAFL